MSGYDVAHLDDLERLPALDGELLWRPVRRRFGIEAFGVNAYTGAEIGDRVVEEHRESQNGHEELYVVVAGRATFTLEDDDVDARAGTFVFVRPGTKRGAVAAEPETTVLAIGGKAGSPHAVSPWEFYFAAFAYHRLGDDEKARASLAEGLELYPESWQLHYNVACFESLTGSRGPALEHLRRAGELDPEALRYAQSDSDFDSIRDDPEFPS